jgi:FXSXX-COOH protein
VDAAAPADDAGPTWSSALLDVSGMSLSELAAAHAGDDSALGRCLRRLAAEAHGPDEPIAGFNSAL